MSLLLELKRPLDMELLKVAFLLLMIAVSTRCQTFHLFSCPSPTLQENFNVTKYLGTWYEIEKLPARFERGTCVQAQYNLNSDGTVEVHNSELLTNGKVNSVVGVAKIDDPTNPAHLSVSFFKGLVDSPYMVLSTDYTSFSLVYSCSDFLGLFYVDFAWILSRTRDLPGATICQLKDKLTAIGVDTKRLSITDQTDCFARASA